MIAVGIAKAVNGVVESIRMPMRPASVVFVVKTEPSGAAEPNRIIVNSPMKIAFRVEVTEFAKQQGQFKPEMFQPYDKLQIVTVQQILDGERINLPLMEEVTKKA